MKRNILILFSIVIVLAIGVYYYLDLKNKSDSENCIQVITYAQNPETRECETFSNPCVVPEGWSSCGVTNFEDCMKEGNIVLESYPRQCRYNGELFVEEINSTIPEEDALQIAHKTKDCSNVGILTDTINYNGITRTWWIDLKRVTGMEKDGCNPACVVNEETKTAEVNWRCTGLNPDSK